MFTGPLRQVLSVVVVELVSFVSFLAATCARKPRHVPSSNYNGHNKSIQLVIESKLLHPWSYSAGNH